MKSEYQGVPQDEESTSHSVAPFQHTSSRWRILAVASLIINIILGLPSLFDLPTLLARIRTQSVQSCLHQTSSHSPLLADISLSLTTTTVNGTLFPNSSPPSIWRSPPSPAGDTAWHHLSRTDLFSITKSDVIALGRNSDLVTAIPESYGFGTNLYLAEIDGQHHLHCLNMLRKYAYLPYYFPQYNSTKSMPIFHQNHLNHCIDILRQQLLCTLSTEVITYRWVKGQSIPQPDFSVEKKCKNHEQIQGWLEGKWAELQMSEEQKVYVPWPDNVEEIEVPSNPYWDELVRKAREKGVSVHEYVE